MPQNIRLDKLLAGAGYGSRKEIKNIVREGKVAVNDLAVKDSSVHVSPVDDKITVNGSRVLYREFVYLMLNKPAGYVSATEDSRDKTVLDLIPEGYKHYELFPVGRLDKDTEGLLLLTNDGKMAHELLAPKKHVPKTYYAEVDGQVTADHVMLFAAGVKLDGGYVTRPAMLRVLSSGESGEVELIIHEGKFHQVKRMFKSIGLTVRYLKRTAMGDLKLDMTLQQGQVRELTDTELKMLQQPKQKSPA